MGEGDFRGITATAEHRFSIKHASDGQSVQSANQIAFAVGFDRMRPAKFMQANIGVFHLWRNPGAVLAWSCSFRTGGNGGREIMIEANFEIAGTQRFTQRMAEAKLFGKEHHARVRAVPERLPFDRAPRENAVPVGVKNAVWCKIGADGKQAAHIFSGQLDRRKGVEWAKKGNHACCFLKAIT